MEMCGYAGEILHVDLSSKQILKEDLDPGLIDLFLGGVGACARLGYDFIPPDVEPMSAENPIIFGTGLLTGTNIPGSSKIPMMTKFPATGIVECGSVGSS